ncbi:MAG: FAD-dependent oxidoreductase [Burkholderiales bacterium 28-67-8]|nr:MAG: FAD-dependent oxidoreductase [Burkholderiales bacterium 28-67-8]
MSLLDTDVDLARDCAYAAALPRDGAFAALDGSAQCDVAIVGGGLAGLSAAIELADRGFAVTVLEAHEVGWGGSGRNGGQVIHGLGCDPQEVERQLGLERARIVWAASLEGMDIIHQRCERFAIDAEWRSGYLMAAVNARRGRALESLADRLASRYDYPLTRIDPREIAQWIASPRFHSALHDARSGHLNPLKYTRGLARGAASLGVRIHEGTRVSALVPGERTQLVTPRGVLSARWVVLAGNVYLQGVAPQVERRVMPVETFIASTGPLAEPLAASLIPSGSAVSDNNFVLDYFRVSADRRMLFGGCESHRLSRPANLAETMRRRMVAVFPQLAAQRVEHVWGGAVDVTLNRAPDFGRVPCDGSRAANVYCLQGFSGHGLALTGIAGRLVAEALTGHASRFDVFARLRHLAFPGGRRLGATMVGLGLAWYRLRDALGW